MAKIRYLSLFSGIEAFSCAVKDMPEFEPVAFAEIEPFPCAVLAHHYPNVLNLGDVSKIDGRKYRGHVDLIVGGSPCQGFSVAGQRKGLNDERSCLALTYVRIIDEVRPKMWLWENVPGAFSTNNGQDIRSFFAALNDIGYSVSWTVLNSEHFGVAQRRRRVFAFGLLGADWQRCAKVLLEPESMCWNPPPRRKAGKGDSGAPEGGARNSGVSGTLCASGAGLDRPSAQGNQLDYLVQDIAFAQNQRDEVRQMDVVGALVAESGMKQTSYVAQADGLKTKTVAPPPPARHSRHPAGVGSLHGACGTGCPRFSDTRPAPEREDNLRGDGGRPSCEGCPRPLQHHRRQTGSGEDVFGTLMAAEAQKCWLTNQNLGGDCWIMEKK